VFQTSQRYIYAQAGYPLYERVMPGPTGYVP
jgi:hypothetical protein